MQKKTVRQFGLVSALVGFFVAGLAHAQTPPGEATYTRVSLPAGYAGTFQLYDKVDKPDRKIVRFLYINKDALAKVKPGDPFPDGTTLVMADHAVALDTAGKPLTGASGRLAATGRIRGIAVMTKMKGWGETNLLPPERDNGDWEYASFKADGAPNPINLGACYACHLPLKAQDFVFSGQKIRDAAKK